MALVDITIDFNLAQLLGSDFDARRTKAYVTTNVESGTLIDTSTGETRLGDEAVTIAADGTGLFTTWAIGADGNPISWQTSLVVDYPRTGQRDRKRRVFGPWTLTAANDGDNITDLEDEQAVPAEYQTAFTERAEAYLAAQQEIAGTDDADDIYVNTVSPLNPAYGAIGNDTADDTVALQAAITGAAAFGVPVDLRGKTYKTTDTLNVPAGSVISNGIIHCTSTGKKILNIAGSNVSLRRLTVRGRHATATAANNEYGIYAGGTSAAAPFTNITIDECAVELVGKFGIWLKWVTHFSVTRCSIGDIGYIGIGGESCLYGVVECNNIEDVLASATFSSNGYGITFGRDETNSLVTDPHSAYLTIARNMVRGVPWEGIDFHGGTDSHVIDNQVYACKTAIAIVESDNASNVATWAPQRMVVRGNICDAEVTDGSAGVGILLVGVAGATTATAAVEYATGVIEGNLVRRHGTQSDSTTGAILIRNTRGVVISGNRLSEPSPHGIFAYYDNRNPVISGNTFIDVWSTTESDAGAVTARSDNNLGMVVIGNNLLTGSKSATYVNRRGCYLAGSTSTANILGNDFSAAVSVVAGGTGATSSVTLALAATAGVLSSAGTAAAPAYSFAGDPDTGIYSRSANALGIAAGGVERAYFATVGVVLSDGYNIYLGTGTGTMLGIATNHKLGFWGATPVVRPSGWGAPTGTATRTTFATSTVTLSELAERVKALIDNLTTIGLIGA